jgi:2'-5' RNA ligase
VARIFVALRLPPAIADRVAAVRRQLELKLVDVKWVETENLHFTLRFFGELEPGAVERAVAAVTAAAAATTPFPLRLEGLGTFPPAGRPRVLWSGVSTGRTELSALASRLEERFVERRLGRADRDFAPHLTLGRVRDPNSPARRGRPAREHIPREAPAAMREAIAAIRFAPVEFRAAGIAVVESRLHPGGPEYLDIHGAAFGEAGAAGGGPEGSSTP